MARAASKISPPYGAVLRSLALASVLLFGPTTRAEQVVGNGEQRDEPITPIPTTADTRPDRIRLGERLFSDARLSRDSAVACSACHHLATGGDDDRALATGLDGRPLDFNTPTIFNVGLNARFDWRGNFRSLEEQNESALLDPRVMHDDWNSLLSELRADATYREAFAATMVARSIADRFWTRLPRMSGRWSRRTAASTGTCAAKLARSRPMRNVATSCSSPTAASRATKVSMWVGICFSSSASSTTRLPAAPSPPRPISVASPLPETPPIATYSVCRACAM